MSDDGDLTELLKAAGSGRKEALDALFQAVYSELRSLAHAQRSAWQGDYTLNTTALVHEAYLKLVPREGTGWNDRAHFFRVASRAMRHILVDYAKRCGAGKRGGNVAHVPVDEANPMVPETAAEVLALNEALERLETVSPRQTRVVECRFFAGLPIRDTAEVLGVSPATVKRDWQVASVWLRTEVEAALNG